MIPVKELMTPAPFTAKRGDLVVVEESSEVVGVISSLDLLAALLEV